MIRVFLLALALTISGLALAKDCTKTGTACIDTAPTKTIGGVLLTLAQVGGCWQYEDTYTCIKPNAINYCQPFINSQPDCWQTGLTCTKTDTLFGTGCMENRQTWRCGDPDKPAPPNTIVLDDTYTLVSSDYDLAACTQFSDNTNCTIAESKCTSTTAPSLPPGISPDTVAPDGCYQKTNRYSCLTGVTDTSDCSAYESNPKCTLVTQACKESDKVAGKCTYETRKYRCETSPGGTKTVTTCEGQMFCTGGLCFDKGYSADKDFGKAIATMETARQGGVYGDPNNLFSGEASKCGVKLFGLSNCCKAKGGGGSYNNNTAMGVARDIGGETLRYGSYYMYDSLMLNNQTSLARGLGALSGAASAGVSGETLALDGFSPSLGMYGFSVSFGAAPAGATVLGSAGGFTFAFDPWSLALSVAIAVVMDMMACEQDEQFLSMKKGQDLCVFVGDYCSSDVLGMCVEKTQGYCCYNSRLARIINEQGRPLIGKGWGSAESPECSGFTQAEFTKLDFSKIDLTEFVQEIMANATVPNSGVLSNKTAAKVQKQMQNYYSTGGK